MMTWIAMTTITRGKMDLRDDVSTHMKKAVMLFKGSKGAQFLFTAKYQNN
jgi:hypothetical protein